MRVYTPESADSRPFGGTPVMGGLVDFAPARPRGVTRSAQPDQWERGSSHLLSKTPNRIGSLMTSLYPMNAFLHHEGSIPGHNLEWFVQS